MRRSQIFLMAAVIVAAGLAAAAEANRPPSRIARPASEAGALETRFAWALEEASKPGQADAVWIGYAVERLMDENSHIGSFHGGGRIKEPSVAEVLSGQKILPALPEGAGEVRQAAKAALDEIDKKGKPAKKVLKEIGVFLRYKAGRTPVLAEVNLSSLDLSFDFEALPLYWLGKAPDAESLALVKKLYAASKDAEAREGLLAAAGCHGAPALVVPFLAGVLGGADPDDLRKDAAFWIGQQNDAEGLRVLTRAARADKSAEVREGAVFAISQVELPAAVDELIALARGAELKDVRKQAVFWIGQMASEKSGPALEEFARKNGDIEIQEQAVFALSQLPDNGGVEPLIKLAKTHPDPRVRKKAVFWLGECDDPRALETLISILKGK
ncbi:MAG TPA: HEAT repeat domain-containing protein [Acidobacteriota bacterium]|nr:HEAT repeat domain-containing protein [Acidobacteriota bacterium]